MPRGILAVAKFTSWDEGIQEGTAYEICEVKEEKDAYTFFFYDDNGSKLSISYFLEPKWAEFNNDMFQLYFQF